MKYLLWRDLEDGTEVLETNDDGSPMVFESEEAADIYFETHPVPPGQEDYGYSTKGIIKGHPLTIELGLEEYATSLHDYWVAEGVEHTCPEDCSRYG